MPAEIRWKDDVPADEQDEIQRAARRDPYFYDLRGCSGRWYVVRYDTVTGKPQRTTFKKNVALANEIYERLTA